MSKASPVHVGMGFWCWSSARRQLIEHSALCPGRHLHRRATPQERVEAGEMDHLWTNGLKMDWWTSRLWEILLLPSPGLCNSTSLDLRSPRALIWSRQIIPRCERSTTHLNPDPVFEDYSTNSPQDVFPRYRLQSALNSLNSNDLWFKTDQLWPFTASELNESGRNH